jgi:hypothetical protein
MREGIWGERVRFWEGSEYGGIERERIARMVACVGCREGRDVDLENRGKMEG